VSIATTIKWSIWPNLSINLNRREVEQLDIYETIYTYGVEEIAHGLVTTVLDACLNTITVGTGQQKMRERMHTRLDRTRTKRE
jgi:hypothetical protein